MEKFGPFKTCDEKKSEKINTKNAGIISTIKFPMAMVSGGIFCKCLLIILILKAYITVAAITNKAYQ